MKTILLTQNKIVFIDEEDYELVSQYKWYPLKGNSTFYATAPNSIVNGEIKTVVMHRLIILALEKHHVDHKNGNGLDNRKENLRVCSPLENKRYQKAYKNCASLYKGVCWDKEVRKWRTDITVNKKRVYLGRFHSEEEAAKAYDAAASMYFKEFAKLNFGEAL